MTTEHQISFESISKKISSVWENWTIRHTKNSIHIQLHPDSGLKLTIDYNDKGGIPNIHLICKTASWHFDGDRTDLHDIISLSFATFLRLFRLDFSFWIINFQNDFGAPGIEIGCTYLAAEQVNSALVGEIQKENLLKEVELLLWSILEFEQLFWNAVGCSCEECRKQSGLETFFEWKIPKKKYEKIEKAVNASEKVNSCHRILPSWIYFRDFKNLTTVIESKSLADLFRGFIQLNNNQLKSFKGINGYLFVSSDIKNYISNYSIKNATDVLRKLEPNEKRKIEFVPFENCFLAIGKNFIVVKESKSGFNQFRIEKEKIRKRHFIESKLLFPPNTFNWAMKVNPERFEGMVKELLEREKYTKWVRKSGATKERDNGRDLLAEIVQTNNVSLNKLDKLEFQTEIKKIVVQCKAYSKSVGKADVSDIRDTIEFHRANGYFLAVSSYVTSPLISHLESLKENHKYFVNWWTKDEIEIRLKSHEDILKRYADIVTSIETT